MPMEINLKDIKFEATGNEEILQNLKVLCTTVAGTIVFDRNFGIDHSILDLPMEIAKARLTTEYITKISIYEPRVKVKEITFENDISGTLTPKVVIELV